MQRDQALQLIGALEDEERPLIVVGDFNTDDTAASATHQTFLAAGYRDLRFDRIDADGDPGHTATHDPDLRNELPHLTRHIDIVFAKNLGRSLVRADIVGDEVKDKTPSGLWPSDHAGVWIANRRR